jgi:4a-hydroxytetrahydrobiopterin dehydratase
MATPLSDHELGASLARLDAWRLDDDSLVKEYRFGSFVEAFRFLAGVALLAERQHHHPEIHNVYDRVVLRLRSHDAGNVVTAADVALAEEIDGLAR